MLSLYSSEPQSAYESIIIASIWFILLCENFICLSQLIQEWRNARVQVCSQALCFLRLFSVNILLISSSLESRFVSSHHATSQILLINYILMSNVMNESRFPFININYFITLKGKNNNIVNYRENAKFLKWTNLFAWSRRCILPHRQNGTMLKCTVSKRSILKEWRTFISRSCICFISTSAGVNWK